jgi:large subunit ribosomal protein L24
MAVHVKKGDMVQIITGDCKGATGRVLRVMRAEGKVVVQGQNLVKKHVRPSRKNPSGGQIHVEHPIHISNVLPVNPKTSEGTRVHYEAGEDGGKRRVASDGTKLSDVRRPTKR